MGERLINPFLKVKKEDMVYINSFVHGNPIDYLLNFDSLSNALVDKSGKNTLTATNVVLQNMGSYIGAKFTYSTSRIICSNISDLSNKTLLFNFWYLSTSTRLTTFQYIFGNDKFAMWDLKITNRIVTMVINGGTSFNTQIVDNNLHHYAIYIVDAGNITLFKDGIQVQQNPSHNAFVATTVQMRIGNNNSDSSAIDGVIPIFQIREGLINDINNVVLNTYNTQKTLLGV